MVVKKNKPVNILPFELYNLDDFLIKEFPVYDPYIEEGLYKDYWTEHVNKCLQGVWGHDYSEKKQKGGYRWMPGNLFFYVNDTIIKMEGDQSKEISKKPLLRDVEWYIFYALTVCDGFSGYSDDQIYTCYKPLGKLQGKIRDDKGKKIIDLNPAEELEIKSLDHILRKPDGTYKEYVDPLKYLYKVHSEPMGIPHFYNELQNIIILATRGCGKSYSVAGGIITYDFVFGSARNAEEFFSMKHSSTVVVGSAKSSKSDELLSKIIPMYEHMREYVGGFKLKASEDLVMYDNNDDVNSPLYQPFTGSLKVGKSLTNMTPNEGGKSYSGTDNKIVHITYKDNSNAGVGYRARRMVVEEAGLLDNFTDVHNENEGSQKRGKKSGYTIYIGTGGDIEKIKGIREAFYKPSGYKCFGMDDIFTNKPGQIGLFIPSYYADNRFKNELGNTRVSEAFAQQEYDRENAKIGGSKRLSGQMISYPIIPSEMFLQAGTNIFPTDLLESRLTDLETGEWEKLAKVGKLKYVNKENTKVFWEPLPLSSCNIIKRWGDEKEMTDEQVKGTIVIYEHPVMHKPPLSHFNFLYLVTYDSVKDEDGGTSMACVQVWKFWDFNNRDGVQFNLVAEWMGRHIGTNGLEKDHEMAFKLACYYDAPIHPEINLKDVLPYGRRTNRFHYFLPRADQTLNKMQIDQKVNYTVGTKISPGMKPDLELWLNGTLHVVVDRDHKIYGNTETYEEIKMVSQIPSMRLCEELLYYNRDDNFDAVSSAFLFGITKNEREEESTMTDRVKELDERNDTFLNFIQGGGTETMGRNPAFSY